MSYPRLLVFLIILILLSSSAPALPAGAQPSGMPTVAVTPVQAAPGEHVTLQGTGWPPGAALVARLYEAENTTGPGADMTGVFQAGADGRFTVQALVPSTLFSGVSRGGLTVVPGGVHHCGTQRP